jgi:hypothetical protein
MFEKVKIHGRNYGGREVEKRHVYLHSTVETNLP